MEKKEEKEEEVMDTPVRSKTAQINIPATKFEESPVFNFLNNLSPIKQVKAVHFSQTINSLNFTSIPSIFTSPHVATLKESRFMRRHQLGDPSKPEFSSDDVSKDDNTKDETDVTPGHKEIVMSGDPIDVPNEPSYEGSQSLNYNFGSPNFNRMTSYGLRTKLKSETDGSSRVLVPCVQEGCDRMFHETEMGMEGSSQIDQTKEGHGCEWDSLISDTADLLNFDSPNDAKALKKVVDPDTRLYLLTPNDMESSQVLVGPSGKHDGGNDLEDQFAQSGGQSELNEFTGNANVSGVSSQSINAIDGGPSDSFVNEASSNLYRGMRRRCLVFELSGARNKNLPDNSNSKAPILPPSEENCMTINKHTFQAKFGNASSRCVLPGIGLHLNALTATSKDYKVVKNESCTSGQQLVIAPGSASKHHLLNSSQDSLSKAVDVTQSNIQIVLFENGRSIQEDGVNALDYMVNDEFNQTSPKKKRRRAESGEDEACKRCNCKKSKCLKLYCECFAAGLYCVEPCSCIDCFNKPSHEDTVLATRKQIESRNPLAFAPKVIRTSGRLSEVPDDSSKTPASARHKRGCNCKKSGCLKKYCECYQSGVGCSINCRCEGCKNAFGRKDGSEIELEVVYATQKILIDGNRQSLDYVNPATPVPFGRPVHHLPFSSKNKPPRSIFFPVGSSSSARPEFDPPPSKFDSNLGLLQEEDIPISLQTSGSPISGIKSLSPNGKRVSSPHTTRETAPRHRSSRKLILQSIPSFPSLTPKNDGGLSSSEHESVPITDLQ